MRGIFRQEADVGTRVGGACYAVISVAGGPLWVLFVCVGEAAVGRS